MTELTRGQVAALVDHTLLKAEATQADVDALVAEGRALGVKAVCVSPSFLPLKDAGDLVVATVCGFPSGKHASDVKAHEAQVASAAGAQEVDMVIDIGAAIAGRYEDVQADIAAVRATTTGLLKVILETACLSDDAVVACCQAAEAAGADFVKTSTGMHAAGGATVHAIDLMHSTVGGRLGIKASGGIRDAEFARQLLAAGATRLGLSGTAAVLDGFPA